jgi:hypothetical protein
MRITKTFPLDKSHQFDPLSNPSSLKKHSTFRSPVTFEQVRHLHEDKHLKFPEVGKRLGISKQRANFIYKHNKGHGNGAPKPIVSAPSTPKGAPQSADLESRVAVLEAYVKALQARESIQVHPVHSNGAPHPTKKRGFVIREDLSHAVDRFAETYHLEIRMVLDEALCEFFERRGFVVGEGEG